MRFISDIDLSGKKVLVRVDFNVPLDSAGNVTDATRIEAALETLKYAIDKGASVIVMSHLGKPKGKLVPQLSLLPAAEMLGHLLDKKVVLAPDCVGPKVESMITDMKSRDVIMLENLRFHKEEEENSDSFARSLASLCDIYINDAFAVCHRQHASVEAITRYAPVFAAGFLLKKEIDYFKKSMTNPKRPLTAILGGAKVSTKLSAIENIIEKADSIIIGGAMANTFLKAKGINIGKSKFESDLIDKALQILDKADRKGVKIFLPEDAVCSVDPNTEKDTENISIQNIPDNSFIVDIGTKTAKVFSEALREAKTVIWNGPMGIFEKPSFAKGTYAVAKALENLSALIIAGGGDTLAAIKTLGGSGAITYMSTGGGAFLALLEGKKLPGIAALDI